MTVAHVSASHDSDSASASRRISVVPYPLQRIRGFAEDRFVQETGRGGAATSVDLGQLTRGGGEPAQSPISPAAPTVAGAPATVGAAAQAVPSSTAMSSASKINIRRAAAPRPGLPRARHADLVAEDVRRAREATGVRAHRGRRDSVGRAAEIG